MISEWTGISLKKMWLFEKRFLKTPNPTNVSQTLLSKYMYFNLTGSDLAILTCIADHFKHKSYSPNNLAASLIYLYCKYYSIPHKLITVANTFQVTTTAIYRCSKYLKSNEFDCILRQHTLYNTKNDRK